MAIDLHVVRVTSRTGLLLHGYGDPRITTEVGRKRGYLFFHDLMLKLARRTGWQAAGYSPGEIDRMFWHFGRAVCKATPACRGCPLASTCLTFPRGRGKDRFTWKWDDMVWDLNIPEGKVHPKIPKEYGGEDEPAPSESEK